MSRRKKITVVHIHPRDVNKWKFPDGWDVVLDPSVTQGEVKTWIYSPKRERKNILLAIWEGLVAGIKDYFTRRNEWGDKK